MNDYRRLLKILPEMEDGDHLTMPNTKDPTITVQLTLGERDNIIEAMKRFTPDPVTVKTL